jgi:hypothetical protein
MISTNGLATIFRGRNGAWLEIAAFAFFLVLALTIGVYDLVGSGPLWPDAPRYANAGAMVLGLVI